jgi:hypothetical protein
MTSTSATSGHRLAAASDAPEKDIKPMREAATVAALTVVFVLARGYGFGIDDHAIHLAFIERARDPGFLPGDPMLAMAAKHPSVYFPLIAMLSDWMPVEAVYLVGYLASVFAMLLGLRMLARSLWPGPAAGWVTVFALAGAFVVRSVAGGIDNFDAIFLPRVLALGPLLFALALCVRGMPLRAFALTGIVFLVHATTASHAALLIWVACLFRAPADLRTLFLGPVVFLLAASPLLAMMAMAGAAGIPTPAPSDWIDAVKLHYPRHHFEAPFIFALHALSASFAVLIGILSSPSPATRRLLAGFLVGAWLLFAAGLIGNNLLRSPHTIQLHVFQAGRLLDCVALVALGGWTYACFRRSAVVGALSLVPTAAYVFSTWLNHLYSISELPASLHYLLMSSLLLLLLVGGMMMTFVLRALRTAEATGPLGGQRAAPHPVIAIAFCALAIGVAVTNSGATLDYQGSKLSGHRLMRWADAKLPADAVVVVPPYLTQPIVAFRHYGRRRILGAWKDGGEGTFDLDFQMQWVAYMRDVFDLPKSVKARDYGKLLAGVNHDYQTKHAEDFRRIARRYGATHLVREAASVPLPFPELYRDEAYVLYRITQTDTPAAP